MSLILGVGALINSSGLVRRGTNCKLRHPTSKRKRRECDRAKRCIAKGESIRSVDSNLYRSFVGECQGEPRPVDPNSFYRSHLGVERACMEYGVLCEEYDLQYGEEEQQDPPILTQGDQGGMDISGSIGGDEIAQGAQGEDNSVMIAVVIAVVIAVAVIAGAAYLIFKGN